MNGSTGAFTPLDFTKSYYSSVTSSAYTTLALLPASPTFPAPAGYFTQADIDAAVAAAGGGGGGTAATVPVDQLTFTQGGEMAIAVVGACMIAVAFGLMRKAAL